MSGTPAVTIAVIGAGAMGAGIAARLSGHGARVLTSLDGRSAATVARARRAGMTPARDEEAMAAGLFLSIVPPDRAVLLAERMMAAAPKGTGAATYVDLNAIAPETTRRVAAIVRAKGWNFVDGGIIGMPPVEGKRGPLLYLSGDAGGGAATLRDHGLAVRLLGGGIGAASALKLAYAGITKGMIALGAAMMLAADKAGVADALLAELAASQPGLLAHLRRGVPDMLPKAARWSPEMAEIARFAGDGTASADVYRALAGFYAGLADGAEAAPLERLAALGATSGDIPTS